MNKNEFTEIESKIKEIQKEIAAATDTLKSFNTNRLDTLLKEEEPELLKRFRLAVSILVTLILLASILIGFHKMINIQPFWICIAAGVNGSAISSLISVLQRKANGWEFKNGIKYPSDIPIDKFSMRVSTSLILRPLLGFVTGMIIFYGINSIFKTDDIGFGGEESRMIFWSLIAGLFAKSLIEKLQNIFDNLIGQINSSG